MNNTTDFFPVICYGEVLWDMLPDGPQPGGAPLNVAYHLNKLGTKAGIMSRIGDDEYGRRLTSIIEQRKIPQACLQVDRQQATSQVIATLGEHNEVTYDIIYPTAWDFIAEDNAVQSRITPSTYLVYGSLAARHEVTRSSLFNLLESDAIKVLDINLRPPFTDPDLLRLLLKKADIVKFNQAELGLVQQLSGNFSIIEAKQAEAVIKAFDLQYVIVTKGAAGATCYMGNKAFSVPGRAVTVMDTIGSGDAFLAAFVDGLYRQNSLMNTLSNAVAMGTFVATRKGGCPEYELSEFQRFKHQLFK